MADKLSKICIVLQNAEANNVRGSRRIRKGGGFVNKIRNTSKCIASLTEISLKVHVLQRRVEAIESSLELLIRRKVIIKDIADILEDYFGISHYTKRCKISMKQLRNSNRGRLKPLALSRRHSM